VTSEDVMHPIESAVRLETLELHIIPNTSGGMMRASLAQWTVV